MKPEDGHPDVALRALPSRGIVAQNDQRPRRDSGASGKLRDDEKRRMNAITWLYLQTAWVGVHSPRIAR